jgi:hypothetical protein
VSRQYCSLILALLVPAVCYSQPAATLGRPRPLYETGTTPSPPQTIIRMSEYEADTRDSGATFQPSFTPPPDYVAPAGQTSVSAQISGEDFLNGRPDAGNCPPPSPSPPPPDAAQNGFGDRILEWLHPGCSQQCDTKHWFESDHAFDYLASPVTSPFLFEDPRALTELKPIFIYQSIPNGDIHFKGGNIEYYGLQGRIALNDRISFVFNELGFITFNPGSGSDQPGGTGFSEIRFGPKFTFLRDTQNGMIAAAGMTFDVPTGPSYVYQDTGSLSVIPYASFAKNFGSTKFGSFNFMDSLGYAFATDSKRSEYLYNVMHVDWDVANNHRFYPLMEFSYFQYTRSGTDRMLNVDGADLANFGDTSSSGRAEFDWSFGFRYKFSESTQVGMAFEFPLGGRKDLNDFRLTIDFIWRY